MFRGPSILSVDSYAVKLHAVIDQAISQLFGNQALQRFEFGIDEFHDLAGFHINEVVMMRFRSCFIAGAPIAEIVPVEYARFLEQADGAVHGGDRNAGIDGGCPFMQFFDIGVIIAFRKDAGNDPSLLRDAQTAIMA